jgi:hypothetical protein
VCFTSCHLSTCKVFVERFEILIELNTPRHLTFFPFHYNNPSCILSTAFKTQNRSGSITSVSLLLLLLFPLLLLPLLFPLLLPPLLLLLLLRLSLWHRPTHGFNRFSTVFIVGIYLKCHVQILLCFDPPTCPASKHFHVPTIVPLCTATFWIQRCGFAQKCCTHGQYFFVQTKPKISTWCGNRKGI